MRRLYLIPFAFIVSGLAFGQNTGGGGSGTTSTVKSGTALPATCDPTTNNVFMKTTAPAGLYSCVATNTWAIPTGSGGIASTTAVLKGDGLGNAVAATAGTDFQAAGNYITGLTGDVTASGPGSAAATLASVGSTGSCGDATHSCGLTFDAKGRETARANTSITFPGITALTGDAIASGPGSSALTLATVNAGPGLCGDSTHVCQVTTNGKGLITLQTPVAIASGGSGTVTSVGLTTPTWLTVTGSPVTGAGTLAVTATGSQTANQFLATPNGVAGAVGLRSIVASDVPTLNQSTTGNAATATALAANPTDCSAGQYANAIAASGNLTCAAVSYGQVSGTPTLFNQTIQNSGTPLTQRSKLNFVGGTNVTITPTDNGTDTTTLTIAASGGGSTSPGGTDTAVQFNNAGAFGGDATNFSYNSTTHALTVTGGITSSSTSSGLITLSGSTSGSAGLSVAASAGTPNTIQLPTATGAANSLLQSDGGSPQVTSWQASTGTGNIVRAASPTLTGTVTVNNLTVSGTCSGCASGSTSTIASGTATLGTSAIASGGCATVVTVTATGVATTDSITWTPNADITAVTGYAPVTTGGLAIYHWPTANNVNFKVCNPTASSITPGAVTLNWRVVR